MMSCYVIGAGAIGLFLQHLLQKSQASTLIAKEAACAALSSLPLRVTGKVNGETSINCQTWAQVRSIPQDSTLIVATKAHQLQDVLALIRMRQEGQVNILLCQNGIGIYEAATRLMPSARVARLSCWMGIELRQANHIHVNGIHKFDLACPDTTLKEKWADSLKDSGISLTLSEDPILSEWQKALWNIAVNGLCSIADGVNGLILEHKELRAIAERLIDEAVSIARLEGVHLSDEDKTSVFRSLEKTKENVNATLQDLRSGRHPELEFLNGAVVQAAARHDQKAPSNATIVDLVAYLEKLHLRKESQPCLTSWR